MVIRTLLPWLLPRRPRTSGPLKRHGATTAGEARTRLLPDRTHTWTTRAGSTSLTRPADPLEPVPIPEDLIDPGGCPF